MAKLSESIKATIRLIDQAGASIMVEYDRVPERTPRERLKAQMRVEVKAITFHDSLVESIYQCDTNDDPAHDPVPPRWAEPHLPRSGRIMVVGSIAAKRTERSDNMLRSALAMGGIKPESISWATAAWCVPGDPRPPGPAELNMWHELTLEAIEAADVDYVLLHGAHAMRLWRPDLAVRDVVGGLYVQRGRRFVSVVPHASSVLRQNGTPEGEWIRHVSAFCQHVREGHGLMDLGMVCVKSTCSTSVYAYDADGVPWCKEHLEAGIKGKAKAVRREAMTRQGQGSLL